MSQSYQTIVGMIERLHRHFLDVLRVELRRLGITDINPVQALLLANIGDDDVVMRDLKDRGYYHGSNVSYTIRKLAEAGYLTQARDPFDRRAVRLEITAKGRELCQHISQLQGHLMETMERHGLCEPKLAEAVDSLERLERLWADYVRYGRL
ncbi:MarR family winged helix-turn-helix transcriptional regulator [Roseospirillum parvum]|uniref:DNA-binding transcriptional regulator, MarR family n=1 Tax=Roseospirillum parvum TaxID=83401 RepID=A0A1G7ZNG3_9PROT|nr:winged helix DNA-binding protein [Roseospirillum parvum]SDH10189.1 DNA-binding transcriptional regulator, MarR family [Roseospirillum parvum]